MWRGGKRKPLRTRAIVLLRSSLLCALVLVHPLLPSLEGMKTFCKFFSDCSIEHFLLISGEKGEKGFVDGHGESCGRSSHYFLPYCSLLNTASR